MHRIIRDTLHCPDPAKMGAASPRELCMHGFSKWIVSTAQPVIWPLQSHSSAGLWAVPRAQHAAAVGSSPLCFCAWSFAPVTFEVGLFQCKLLWNVMTDP